MNQLIQFVQIETDFEVTFCRNMTHQRDGGGWGYHRKMYYALSVKINMLSVWAMVIF